MDERIHYSVLGVKFVVFAALGFSPVFALGSQAMKAIIVTIFTLRSPLSANILMLDLSVMPSLGYAYRRHLKLCLPLFYFMFESVTKLLDSPG